MTHAYTLPEVVAANKVETVLLPKDCVAAKLAELRSEPGFSALPFKTRRELESAATDVAATMWYLAAVMTEPEVLWTGMDYYGKHQAFDRACTRYQALFNATFANGRFH